MSWRSGAIYAAQNAVARVAGGAPRNGWLQTVNSISAYAIGESRRRYDPRNPARLARFGS